MVYLVKGCEFGEMIGRHVSFLYLKSTFFLNCLIALLGGVYLEKYFYAVSGNCFWGDSVWWGFCC